MSCTRQDAPIDLSNLMHYRLDVGASEDHSVEALRQLRNECREFMTEHTDHISQDEQRAWWRSLNHAEWRIWIYSLRWHGIVGFGLLRARQGQWSATLGVCEAYRGLGIGTEIYRHLLREVGTEPISLKIRHDNEASRRAAEKAGFIEVTMFGSPVIECIGPAPVQE